MDVAGEPRLVGFNTGPGPEPGNRGEVLNSTVRLKSRCPIVALGSTLTLTHKSTSHCRSTSAAAPLGPSLC